MNFNHNPNSAIGCVSIDPAMINSDHSYILECPEHSKPLCAGWINDSMVLWVQVPAGHAPPVKIRLWIVPGGTPLALGVGDNNAYLGPVIVPEGSEDAMTFQDWHFFHDRSNEPLHMPAQSSYALH